MNDISVKTVESPKGAVVVASPAPDLGVSEVDPLAIDDDEVAETKEEEPAVEKLADCDENAKDETSTAGQEDDQNVPVPTEDVKITEELKEVVEESKEATKELKEHREELEDIIEELKEVSEETKDITEELKEVTEELKGTSEELAEKNTSNSKTEEPVIQPVTTSQETVEEAAKPTPETEAAPSVPIFDPPTPDLNTPPPEEEEAIQEPAPDPLEEVKEDPPKAPSPAQTTKVIKPEIPEEALVQSTDVEMTEVPVRRSVPAKFGVPEQPTQEAPVHNEVSTSSVLLKSLVSEKETKVPVVEEKQEPKVKLVKESDLKPINGDIIKEEQAAKRRASEEVEADSPLKRLCQEVEKTFPQHDTMINDYIQTATKNNIDEIQRHTEQLLAEIQTLRELAQKKEHEWNNILHLKKVKEEILLRLLRRKQVLSFEKSAEVNGAERPGIDPFDFLNQAKHLAIDKSDEISGLAIKQTGSTMNPMMQAPVMPVTTHFNPMSGLPPPYDKAAQMHMQNMPKPVFPQQLMMPGTLPGFPRDMNGQLPSNFNMPMGRQGPTKDVKSIIADYRQRNPDVTPRRGRRMKSILNPNMMNAPRAIAPKVDNMNNMTNMNNMANINNLNNLNMLFNNLDMNQKAMLERLQQIQAGGLPNSIFKDALVQFANMQQSAGLLPNRPPETITNRPEHHVKERRRERNHEQQQQQKQQPPERMPSTSPRLPPPPYPEISLLPVTGQDSAQSQQNSLLHGILTKQAPPQSFSPTLAKLLTSPERKSASAPAVLPTFGQAKNCGEITITPVQPTPPPDPQPEKTEEVVQLDDEESPASEGEAAGSPAGSGSGSGRLVIDEGGASAVAGGAGEGSAGDGAEGGDTPLCQGCRRRDAQFVCAGCANQWYCSRDCQVAAWDEHSEMCSG